MQEPLDARPPPGEPPLHRAARLGDHAAIRALTAQGADLNEKVVLEGIPDASRHPVTPLLVAAGSADGASAETVRLLIELGASPRLSEDGEIATRLLGEVASRGDAARLRALLEAGASPHAWDDPEKRRRQDKWMEDELRKRRPAMLKELGLPEEQAALIEELMQSPTARWDSSAGPWPHLIPLFCAVEGDSLECVRLLLEAGADAGQRDTQRRTALWCASSEGVIRELLARGLRLDDRDEHGWTPLDDAVSVDADLEAALRRLHALLACGADVHATHDRGYTVLMSAVGAAERHPRIVEELVAAGADPHAVSQLGYNAFHAAIDVNGEANDEESVRAILTLLRRLGVDLERRNHVGHTPLARAIGEGTAIEVRVLCELGADPNAHCPLPCCGEDACERADEPLIFHVLRRAIQADGKLEALLKAGARTDVTDSSGRTPLECARARVRESGEVSPSWKKEAERCVTLLREAEERDSR